MVSNDTKLIEFVALAVISIAVALISLPAVKLISVTVAVTSISLSAEIKVIGRLLYYQYQ